jgi:fermentation-respiration switch protein FrsA (DUF1100 family)
MKLPRTSRVHRAWLLVADLLAVAVVGILVFQTRPNAKAVLADDAAPPFSLLAARGGRCDLTDLLARKRVVLLSFVDARSLPLSPTYSDPSRGQLVFLKSMARQYAPKGVEVLIVGCNGLCGGPPLAPSALLNFTYDWQLDGVTVLRDDAATALRYGVSALPTTLLIASDGRIQRRWDRFVPPAQLALALESLVGSPPFRQ